MFFLSFAQFVLAIDFSPKDKESSLEKLHSVFNLINRKSNFVDFIDKYLH